MRKMRNAVLALILSAGLGGGLFSQTPAKGHEGHDHGSGGAASPASREFTVVGIEYEGSKVWVPGTLIVKKGDKVKINLVNNIKSDPNTHGYAIDEFGIKAVVARGKKDAVEFTADKEGVFSIYCQLHPAHIGGQLLVLK